MRAYLLDHAPVGDSNIGNQVDVVVDNHIVSHVLCHKECCHLHLGRDVVDKCSMLDKVWPESSQKVLNREEMCELCVRVFPKHARHKDFGQVCMERCSCA